MDDLKTQKILLQGFIREKEEELEKIGTEGDRYMKELRLKLNPIEDWPHGLKAIDIKEIKSAFNDLVEAHMKYFQALAEIKRLREKIE